MQLLPLLKKESCYIYLEKSLEDKYGRSSTYYVPDNGQTMLVRYKKLHVKGMGEVVHTVCLQRMSLSLGIAEG